MYVMQFMHCPRLDPLALARALLTLLVGEGVLLLENRLFGQRVQRLYFQLAQRQQLKRGERCALSRAAQAEKRDLPVALAEVGERKRLNVVRRVAVWQVV